MDLQCNPRVASMHAYTPGEQPQGSGWIKLNTNEFPYPPAPAVMESVAGLASDPVRGPESARKYPDPHCTALRQAIALRLGVPMEQVLMGNGSDEVLRLLFHAFLNSHSDQPGAGTVAVLNPTYSLYDTLSAMFGGQMEAHQALEADGMRLPDGLVNTMAAVAIVANPNPPLGTLYPLSEIRRLLSARAGRLTVVDEAYVDFAGGQTALSLLKEFPNLAVTRTLSKGAALAGLRVGYVVASTEVVGLLDRIRDSYNVNALSQVAALAAVESDEYYSGRVARIIATRDRTAQRLRDLGFTVAPSAGNFLFVRHRDAQMLLAALRTRKILVRHFNRPGLADGLRITVGTESEMERLIEALRDLVGIGLEE